MSKKRSKKVEPQQPPPPPKSEVEDEETQSEAESVPKHISGKRKSENALGGETSEARQRSDTESDDEPPEPRKKHARKGEEMESSRKKRRKESKEEKSKKDEQDDEVVEVKPDVKPSAKKGWQPKDETTLAKQMLADLKSKPGLDLRDKTKGDDYWGELCETLKGKLTNDFTEDQIFEKYKRMKIKFGDFEAHKTFKTGKRRNAELHEIYKQLWGGDEDATTPGKAQAAHSYDSEDGETTGIPLLRPVKREVPENGFSPVLENGSKHTSKKAKHSEALMAFSPQEQQHLGPAVNLGALLCNSVESMIKLSQDGLVKLLEATTEEERKRRKEERRRMLKEQAAEYSRMKTRLRLVLEYCEQEEANVKKMLEEL